VTSGVQEIFSKYGTKLQAQLSAHPKPQMFPELTCYGENTVHPRSTYFLVVE
jgi:hypothetical protein